MLFTLLSTASMAGIAGSAYLFRHRSASKDHEKIKTIADTAGLKTSEGSIRIYRTVRTKKHSEYIYKIPLGLSFRNFEEKKQLFIDGLNNKSEPDFNLQNLKNINWREGVLSQLKDMVNNRIKLDKEIEMTYDGMLRFKVYDRGLESTVQYNDDLLAKLNGWEVPIGNALGEFVAHDFEKMQMLVVAGMTRYGKTVFLKNIITTLISNKPYDAQFTLIDLKGGLAFSRFSNCKQVLQVAKSPAETLMALEGIHEEMNWKQQEFLTKGYEDIGEAGYKKRHFIVIDEGAEIAGFADKKERERCSHLIGEIARIGAGLGYRLIFATQYPTADVFPRQVKANTSAALCFKLKNSTQSMVVLDRAGAEDLPVGLKGRAIYQTDQDRIVQTPHIENPFIEEKIKIHIKAKGDLNANCSEPENREGRTDTFIIEETRLS